MRLRYPHDRPDPQAARRADDLRASTQPGPAARRAQRRHRRRRPGRGRHPARVAPRSSTTSPRSARWPAPAEAREHGMLANEHHPRLHAVRPLRQPDRRGRVPPVLALADGARGRPRARRDPVGVRLPARPRPPGRRLHGVVAHRARPRLPGLDDVRRGAGAARRRRARQGVDAAAGLDRRTTPACGRPPSKRGALAGMGMTEKQGGSDVRANVTAGRADLGRRRVHPARPQVVHLRADERRLPGARPGRGRACHLLRGAAGAARRHPQPARRRPAQGQARQPLQRLGRARARRHARATGSATRAAASAPSSRWSRRPGSTACWARRR